MRNGLDNHLGVNDAIIISFTRYMRSAVGNFYVPKYYIIL